MNILIIGAGFLGKYVGQLLQQNGHTVFATYNSMQPSEGLVHQFCKDSYQFDFLHCDIDLLLHKIENCVDRVDTIVLAGSFDFLENNKELSLLERRMKALIQLFGEKHIVYVSSDGIFDGRKCFYVETDDVSPVTLYGRSLAVCEKEIMKASRWSIVRPSYIYGYGIDGQFDNRLRAMIDEIEKTGEIERFENMFKSPLGVEQVAEAIMEIVQRRLFHEIFHLGGERMSVFDFHQQALRAIGMSGCVRSNRMPQASDTPMLPDTSLNNEKMHVILGIEPKSILKTLSPQQ